MDNRSEIRDFLATRRAKLTPSRLGYRLPGVGVCPGCAAKKLPYWLG